MTNLTRSNVEPVRVFGTEEAIDNLGRLKVSRHQNIFEADFEYGLQPLRWETLTNGAGSAVTHQPGEGGVLMRLGATANAYTIRQTRPYHRYQPGKSMFMASAVLFGPARTGQRQRVGFYDDSNGVFFEQGDPTVTNPSGMGVVLRSDAGGVVTNTRIEQPNWTSNLTDFGGIDWNAIQMIWMEFAWYGAGLLRWGIFVDGIPYTLHSLGRGNKGGVTRVWARTGNLPVRYEQLNITAQSTANDMYHYGVSVIVEGGIDDQRGFTYAYGTPWNATSANAGRRSVVAGAGTAGNRIPLVSIRGRTMGTQEAGNTSGVTLNTGAITAGTTTSLTVTGTPMTAGAYVGRFCAYVNTGVTYMARITANTSSVLTLADPIVGGAMDAAPVAGQNYTIGMVNRGQLLPRRLQIISDRAVLVELLVSTPSSPVVLTGATFTALGGSSFALIDSAATAATGGEIVYSIFVPANNPVDQAIDNLFPLVTNLRGTATDIMSVLVTNTDTTNAALVSVQIIGQEAMS